MFCVLLDPSTEAKAQFVRHDGRSTLATSTFCLLISAMSARVFLSVFAAMFFLATYQMSCNRLRFPSRSPSLRKVGGWSALSRGRKMTCCDTKDPSCPVGRNTQILFGKKELRPCTYTAPLVRD